MKRDGDADISDEAQEAAARARGHVKVYAGEYFQAFDHRFATWEGAKTVRPTESQLANRAWESRTEFVYPVDAATSRWEEIGWELGPYLALRRQASTTNETTAIAAILPPSVVEGSASAFWGIGIRGVGIGLLCAVLNSFVFNYLIRLRQSGANLSKSVDGQLPVPVRVVEALGKDRTQVPKRYATAGKRRRSTECCVGVPGVIGCSTRSAIAVHVAGRGREATQACIDRGAAVR
jgi:hypothetical protein